MFLKPATDRPVPDPDKGGHLPPEGRDVVPHQYWLRRLSDGDVVESSPPQPPQSQQPKASPKAAQTKE